MVYITLGGVTGPLLTKYYILVHFAGQKRVFGPLLHSILISLHGNSFKMSQLCATMHYYMVYIIWGSFWAVIDEILHFGPFCGSKKRVFGPLLHSILISLHGNSFKMSQLCVTMH